MKKKLLFIDRDGTIIKEPPGTFQVDSLEQLVLLPGVIRNIYRLQKELKYELVMVSNQDGLGTDNYPEENFNKVQSKLMEILKGEGIVFQNVHIDRTYPHEQKNTRKPGIGMLHEYFDEQYDLQHSFVIGDRITDVQLAANLGTTAIFIKNYELPAEADSRISFIAEHWDDIYNYLKGQCRTVLVERKTSETEVSIKLNPDGTGQYAISTGLRFFDHMLQQLTRHSNIDLYLNMKGDLDIDEHHTIEDTGIALGIAFAEAVGNKAGMERYGYSLPMDDCLAQAVLDFGGRSWLVWDADFKRERIGDVPTEMFVHFFKSFCDNAKCNLNIKAEGTNEHHKIEAIFKAFARAVKMAVKTDTLRMYLPTTKGVL